MLQQYRESKITKYSKHIACFLVVEKNNELLMNNRQARLIGATIVLEVNVVNNHMCGRIRQGRNNEQ